MISSRNACPTAARLLAVGSVLLWLPSCGSSGGGTITERVVTATAWNVFKAQSLP
jgi:hypothetical protein